MNYAEMSDFEVSKRVAILLGHNCYYGDGSYTNDNAHVTVKGNGLLGWFQPRVEPHDAWRIIVDNKIGITFVNGEWRASSVAAGYHEFSNINALRAVCCCFLLMNNVDISA